MEKDAKTASLIRDLDAAVDDAGESPAPIN
jgi:hypothetical protein